MSTAEIHISEVLAEMEKVAEDGSLMVFSIGWVRDNKSKNGPRGSIKRVEKATKGVRRSKSGRTTGAKATGQKWQFKSYQGMPIIDTNTQQMLTPKFTHIIEFNGKKVRHYGVE